MDEIRTQRVVAEGLIYTALDGDGLEEKLSAMQRVLDELAAHAAAPPDRED